MGEEGGSAALKPHKGLALSNSDGCSDRVLSALRPSCHQVANERWRRVVLEQSKQATSVRDLKCRVPATCPPLIGHPHRSLSDFTP